MVNVWDVPKDSIFSHSLYHVVLSAVVGQIGPILTTLVNDLGLCVCVFLVGSGNHDLFCFLLWFCVNKEKWFRDFANRSWREHFSVITCTPGHSLWEYIFVSNAQMEQDGLADDVESYKILPTRDPKGVTRPLFKKLFLSQNGKQPLGPDEIRIAEAELRPLRALRFIRLNPSEVSLASSSCTYSRIGAARHLI
jgi:hypothetical protein